MGVIFPSRLDVISASGGQVIPNLFRRHLVDLMMEYLLLIENSGLMRALSGFKVKPKLFEVIFKLFKMQFHLLLLSSLLIHYLHVLISLFLYILKNFGILLLGNVQTLIGIISKLFN